MGTPLFKSTIVIWTTFDPTETELAALAHEATDGNGYASHQDVTRVDTTTGDPHLTASTLSFFGIEEGTAAATSRVSATLTSDDSAWDEVEFDAAPWFQTALPAEIRDLVECGFGGDYPADAVAQHFSGIHEEITEALDQCAETGGGYEVHVNAVEAIAWIAAHRPDSLTVQDQG